MSGIYEHDGELLYGDGRKVETMPEPDKILNWNKIERAAKAVEGWPGFMNGISEPDKPELDEKTLEEWHAEPQITRCGPFSKIILLIDALRATRQELDHREKEYRILSDDSEVLQQRIAELEQQLAEYNEHVLAPLIARRDELEQKLAALAV